MKCYPLRFSHRLLCRVVFLVLLFFCGPAFGASDSKVEQDSDLSSFLRKIEAAAAAFDSFHAQFRQEKELSLFAEPMIFHGEITVVRPDKLRWEFTSPVPSVLILDGDKGVRCSEGAPPVAFDLSTDPVMRSVAQQMWLWLGGDYGRLEESYHIEKSGPQTLAITPEDAGIARFIARVSITFADPGLQPKSVEIVEPGGDLTRLLFSDYQFGIEVGGTTFQRCENSGN